MKSIDRYEARNRPRRVIFNNDGCDVFLNDGGMSAQSLLDARTAALAESHLDSLFYCTVKNAFGFFTHDTAIGQVWTRQDGRFAKNLMPALLRQGTDPLKVMAEWARANRREIIWSLRMNDTHDGWAGWDNPDRPLSRIKLENRDWLMGTPENPPPFGRWTALNYRLQPVRDWIFNLIAEAVDHYDLDGVECDFLRHETFFPTTAAGLPCTDEERALMTGLMRRVRARLDRVAEARGRPLLLAVRVPDSAGLCRDLGMDIETWLAEGLVDMVAVTCYYRLNPWEISAELGRRYGVPVYAGLSESRVIRENREAEPLRQTMEAYRGRALDAWQAGMSGLYFFNLFDPHAAIWREAGDPLLLARKNRIHFASIRSYGQADRRFPNHHLYRTAPLLAPDRAKGCSIPLRHELAEVPLAGGGHVSAAREIELRLAIRDLEQAAHVAVRWNGEWLPAGVLREGVVHLPLRADQVRPVNRAGAMLCAAVGTQPVWDDLQLWVAAEGSIGEMERTLGKVKPY